MTFLSKDTPIVNYVLLLLFVIQYIWFVKQKWAEIQKTIEASPESPSQKRFAIFICIGLVVELCFIHLFLGIAIPEHMWYGILGIILTGLGMTAWEKVKLKQFELPNPTEPSNQAL